MSDVMATTLSRFPRLPRGLQQYIPGEAHVNRLRLDEALLAFGKVLARGDLISRHPEIAPFQDRLKDPIDDVTMRRLNREVARHKQTAASMVEKFLRERGLRPWG